MRARALLAMLFVLSLVAPAAALEIRASAGLTSEVVEVGEPVDVTLTVDLDQDIDPSKPNLTVPANMRSSGASTSSFRIEINGSLRKSYVARWVLVPNAQGTFTIPAPSVTVDGKVVAAPEKLTLKVVAEGQGPPRRERRRNTGMGSFFGPSFPFDLDDPFFRIDGPKPISKKGQELALDSAIGEHAFLYIHQDKTDVIVGEQVTLQYWQYFDVPLGDGIDFREPPLAGFFREAIVEPGDAHGSIVTTTVGGKRWYARQLAEIAVFPVRAGEVHTGSAKLSLRIPSIDRRRLVDRVSNDVVVTAHEPPLEGRPVGYVMGTVGRFKLAAEVAPRETIAGETVSVRVKVTGLGLLPSELRVPVREGIEWIKPEKKEEISTQSGRVGGWRSFGYAVRFAQPGDLDLGTIELPYYDPDKKLYDVATVELGKVAIKPGKVPAAPTGAEAGAEKDPFTTLGPPHPALGPYDADPDAGIAPPVLIGLVVTPPLAVLLSGAAVALWRRLRKSREAERQSPAVLARKALEEMDGAGDAKASAAAAERAVHLAIEAATGVRARALLLDALGDALRERGLAPLAEPVCALLGLTATMRFSSAAAGEGEVAAEARRLVKELLKYEPDRKEEAG